LSTSAANPPGVSPHSNIPQLPRQTDSRTKDTHAHAQIHARAHKHTPTRAHPHASNPGIRVFSNLRTAASQRLSRLPVPICHSTQSQTPTHRHRGQSNRQTDRQTDRQARRQAGRQTDRRTDRHTDKRTHARTCTMHMHTHCCLSHHDETVTIQCPLRE